MTDEVARLVLRHNYDQNLALASAVFQAASMAGVHEDWMERLTIAGSSTGRSSSCRPARSWLRGAATSRGCPRRSCRP